jgi:hypothetical protein
MAFLVCTIQEYALTGSRDRRRRCLQRMMVLCAEALMATVETFENGMEIG